MRQLALCLVAWLLLAPAVFGQQVDSAARGAARSLGYEGIQAYEAGDIPTAVDRLERAYQVLRVPSLALWSGRALEKSGQWVEASERYLEATRLPVEDASERSVQEQARVDARAAEAELRPKIPLLVIDVRGADSAGVTVTSNGVKVNPALLGTKLPTNPGDVLVVGEAPPRRVEARATALEGQTISLLLDFAPAPAPVAATTAPPAATSAVEDSGAKAHPGKTQRLLGWILIGTGGGALVLGGVTGGLALAKQGQLDMTCPTPSTCPAGTDLGGINTLRILSTVGFIAGGVLGATGTTLVLTAPKAKGVAVRGRLGFATVELEGTF